MYVTPQTMFLCPGPVLKLLRGLLAYKWGVGRRLSCGMALVKKLGCVSLGKSESGLLIQDHLDYGSNKGTEDSLSRVDSSVPLVHHDPSDLGSKIRIRIFPKKSTLKDDTNFNSFKSALTLFEMGRTEGVAFSSC